MGFWMAVVLGMIVAAVSVIAIPIAGIWTYHRRKLYAMELEARGREADQVTAQIEELRDELRALRDTTMQYDLSFDTSLQRLESRMQHLETRNRVGAAVEEQAPLSSRLGN
ncbi:MAG: hypothetical protein KGJ62_03935 [Armatimonadetes bacterium]|nr:hypothetical protein [Armatimonadota bacterium]MDE2208004.1 hypothetical protein [Armatimonadota bacterium]